VYTVHLIENSYAQSTGQYLLRERPLGSLYTVHLMDNNVNNLPGVRSDDGWERGGGGGGRSGGWRMKFPPP
jgi:hypothetical protein